MQAPQDKISKARSEVAAKEKIKMDKHQTTSEHKSKNLTVVDCQTSNSQYKIREEYQNERCIKHIPYLKGTGEQVRVPTTS
jgi:hypothetical protein